MARRKRQYKGYQFLIEQTEQNYHKIVPLSFTWKAQIIEKTAEESLKAFKKYIDRVLHYNIY